MLEFLYSVHCPPYLFQLITNSLISPLPTHAVYLRNEAGRRILEMPKNCYVMMPCILP